MVYTYPYMVLNRLFFGLAIAAVLFAAPLVSALTAEERVQLEQQLVQVEAEIRQNEAQLSDKQKERTSLERDVAILDSKIKQAQLAIKQRDLAIKKIKADIADLAGGISTLDGKVAAGQESLAQILRRTRQIDDMSLAELALGGTLDELFQDLDDFQQVQKALDTSFTVMSVARSDLSSRKEAREAKQREENELLQLQVIERQTLQDREKEKSDLVKAAKGQEANYQKVITEKKKTATQIKNALFGLRDGGAIPFGTAYQYAKDASAKTGVRPALILGVLRQETNLGANVGQCYMTNSPNKGDGIGKNTGRAFKGVMKPDRDVDPYMQITSELGIDPFTQVVSCPQSVGYGGAMGAAQFIPSTWLLYKPRLAAATGDAIPNPWDPRTAIFATGFLMKDNGADEGTRAAERRAALRYFAGGNWNKPSFASYGDGVMRYADEYQADIDVLEGR